MSATLQKLLVVAVAVCALVATVWTSDTVDAVLLPVALGLLGWVGLRRPGDVPPVAVLFLCLAPLLEGCTKTACAVIKVADYACTTLVLADGSEVALTRSDVATPEALGRALGKRGVVGCR